MDESFTSDDYDYDNDIRPADGSKRELLQQDTRTEYEKQIEEAINLSSMEYREKEINANCDISPAAIEMFNKSVTNPEELK